jgi:hypothetical protein
MCEFLLLISFMFMNVQCTCELLDTKFVFMLMNEKHRYIFNNRSAYELRNRVSIFILISCFIRNTILKS